LMAPPEPSGNQRARLVRGLLSLTGAEAVSKVGMFVTFAYLARVLGPLRFGYLEFASSVALCAGFFVDQGFGVCGAREIARRPASTARLVAEVVTLRSLLALATYALICLFAYSLERPAIVKNLIYLFGAALLVMPLTLQWVYQGHDKMRPVALMQVAKTGLFMVVVFSLLTGADDLWVIPFAEVCGLLGVVALSVGLYRSQVGAGLRLRFQLSWDLLRAGSTIGLSQLFWALRTYGANIVVGLIALEQHNGYFTAAMRVTIGLNVFVWLYFFNLLPSFTRSWHHGGGPEVFKRLLGNSIRSSGWLALIGGVLWITLSPWIIGLAYGDEFAPAAVVFKWMSAMCVLGIVHGNFRFGLIAADFQRQATICAGLGTFVALALIPVGYGAWGILGAAYALLLGELAVFFSSYAFSCRLLGVRRVVSMLARPASAACLVVVLLWCLPENAPMILSAGCGLGLSVMLMLLSESRLRAALRRRP
jgi:O-antigen/teichoic acid export membrane protein